MISFEAFVSILCCGVIFSAAAMRLNLLHIASKPVTFWFALEVVGLITLMGGSVGAIGEWFMDNLDVHAETIVYLGAAIFAIGISRGQLCSLVARLQGWDGVDRRQLRR